MSELNRHVLSDEVYKSPEFQAFAKKFGILMPGQKSIAIFLPLNGFMQIIEHRNVKVKFKPDLSDYVKESDGKDAT